MGEFGIMKRFIATLTIHSSRAVLIEVTRLAQITRQPPGFYRELRTLWKLNLSHSLVNGAVQGS
jgi:hypothetical protein